MKIIFRRIVDKIISTCITPSLRRQGLHVETLISKASRFVACEVVEGDYLEFGVYQGASLIEAYRSLKEAFESRIRQLEGCDVEANSARQKAWDEMRFYAFDSYEGLPEFKVGDSGTSDFKKGMYACSIDDVKKNITDARVPLDRITFIKGWFSDTCNVETTNLYKIRKASIVWIDGDLYSSARDVLNFVQDLLQDGTILVFDDWFSYRGSSSFGEQRAFFEWMETTEVKGRYRFQEYTRESWKRMAFIVNTI